MDSFYVSIISIAYDLIKERWTEKEKENYENNILNEITLLEIADQSFNIQGMSSKFLKY